MWSSGITQKWGLVPADDSEQNLFDLTRADLDIVVQDFYASVTATLHYDGVCGSDTNAQFVFPTRHKGTDLAIHDCRATIGDVTDTGSRRQAVFMLVNAAKTLMTKLTNEGNKVKCDPNITTDKYTFLIGDVPDSVHKIVTVSYACVLDRTPDGKLLFEFPDIVRDGQLRSVRVEAKVHHYWADDVSKPKHIAAHQGNWTYACTRDCQTGTFASTRGLHFKMTSVNVNTTAVDFFIDGRDHPEYLVTYCEEHTADNETTVGYAALSLCPGKVQAGPSYQTNQAEFIFVVDRSGSMSGDRIQHAKETLLLFLKSLPVGCQFNVIGFGNTQECLFPGASQVYSSVTLQQAMQFQAKQNANLGGTYLLGPLTTIYKQKPTKNLQRIVFILTDGCVSSRDQCLKIVRDNAQNTVVNAFGIGSSFDSVFIEECARAGGGIHDSVSTTDRSMETKVMNAMRLAMDGRVSDVSITWHLPDGLKVDKTTGYTPGHLIAGERKVMFAKFTGKLQGPKTSKGKKKKPPSWSVQISASQDGISKMLSTTHLQPAAYRHPYNPLRSLYAQAGIQDVKDSPPSTSEGGDFAIEGNLLEKTTCLVTKLVDDYVQLVDELRSEDVGKVVGISNLPGFPSTVAPPLPPAPMFGAHVQAPAMQTVPKRAVRARPKHLGSINKATVLRLARRGGVARLSSLVHEEIRANLENFLRMMVKDAILYAENGKRRTVSEQDVDCALRKNGVKMYGIEEYAPPIYEDAKVGRQRRPRGFVRTRKVIKRSTPIGQPNATSSAVASLFGVPQSLSVRAKRGKPSTRKISARNSAGSPTQLARKPTVNLNPSPDLPSTSQATFGSAFSPPASATGGTDTGTSRAAGGTKRKRGSVTAPAARLAAKRGRVTGKANKPTPPMLAKTSTRSRSGASNSVGVPDFGKMISLITMQQFDGHWSLSAELGKLVEKSLETLMNSQPVKNSEAWATAIALQWLEKRFPAHATEWQMIHDKGVRFLEGIDLEGHTTASLQAATGVDAL